MSTLPLLTRLVTPGGSVTAWLESSARVTALSYEWTWAGGPSSATLSLAADPDAHPPGLVVGAAVSLFRGTRPAWTGRVSNIDPGEPWQVQIDGLAGATATTEPVAVSGTSATSLDTIVDNLITAGLPWTRPATLGSGLTWNNSNGQSTDAVQLDQVLTDTLTPAGKVWSVDQFGALTAAVPPTSPTYLLTVRDDPPLTLNNYATRVVAYYTPTGFGGGNPTSTVTAIDTVAEAVVGRVSKTIVVTPWVGISAAQALTYAQTYLAAISPRLNVAGDITVQPGDLATLLGATVDLATFRPGVMVRLRLRQPTRQALTTPTTAVDMIVGRTSYDAAADTLTLSPVNSTPDPISYLFGRRDVTLQTPAT